VPTDVVRAMRRARARAKTRLALEEDARFRELLTDELRREGHAVEIEGQRRIEDELEQVFDPFA
jgi:hypothetical protein